MRATLYEQCSWQFNKEGKQKNIEHAQVRVGVCDFDETRMLFFFLFTLRSKHFLKLDFTFKRVVEET